MTAYFFDSSAIVKRYVPEVGSDWIRAIADPAADNLLIISRLTWVEVLSALARRNVYILSDQQSLHKRDRLPSFPTFVENSVH